MLSWRTVAGVLLAVFIAVPVALVASPAQAAVPSCSITGTITYSPALPTFGDPTTVVPTLSGAGSLTGCVGIGVTNGTYVFTGVSQPAENCDSVFGAPGGLANARGTAVITWNTGQTTTLDSDFALFSPFVTAGFLQGVGVSGTGGSFGFAPNCSNGPLGTGTYTAPGPELFTFPSGATVCVNPLACREDQTASATINTPGLTVNITGTPAVGAGTVALQISHVSLPCTNVAAVAYAADVTDTGFTPADRLTVTATIPIASTTSAEQVCFRSSVPFKSQSSPGVAKAGTALLLGCGQVANVAPCVSSSKEVGPNVVVTFVIPGADPIFTLVLPHGREMWVAHYGTGRVGVALNATIGYKGGLTPLQWSIASGTLPDGCTLSPRTGVITGKPKKKGSYPVVVKAVDSEKPQGKTATINVPIKIN